MMFKIIVFFMNNTVRPVLCEIVFYVRVSVLCEIVFYVRVSVLYEIVFYVRVSILLTCGKHLHERIISLRVDVWFHNTSLTLPFLFKRKRGIHFASFRDFIFDLELLRQCGIFYYVFHFIYSYIMGMIK